MKANLLFLFFFVYFVSDGQNPDTINILNKIPLTATEATQLTKMFSPHDTDYLFKGKILAYVGGSTGNCIISKNDFFTNFVFPVINKEKKNVCSLLILTKEEKQESGGFDAIILTPVKVYSDYYKKKTIQIIKTAR